MKTKYLIGGGISGPTLQIADDYLIVEKIVLLVVTAKL